MSRRWPARTAWPARTRSRKAGPGRSRTTPSAPAAPTSSPRSTRRAAANDRRSDFDDVYGDWSEVAAHVAAEHRQRRRPMCSAGLKLAAEDPAALLLPRHEDEAMALFDADGSALDELARIADDLRKDVNGEDITYVVNRNINFTNVCYVGCRFCAFAQREQDADAYRLSVEQVADRAEQAWRDGASEVCMQGGIDPKMPVTAYADLVRAVKRRVPGMHVHAYSPDGDRHGRRQGRRAGPGVAAGAARGRPGHDPGHGRRDPRRRRPLGADQGQAAGQHLGRRGHHGTPGGHPVQLDHDVRPRRPPAAVARPFPGAGRGRRT